MTKWGNFAITHVSYNEDNSRIVKVKRRIYKDGKLVDSAIKTRSVIVDAIINKKYSYVTARLVGGTWNLGDDVIAYELDGEYFIRTDGNKTKLDNLGELPNF